MKTFCIATNAACLEHLPLVEKLTASSGTLILLQDTHEKKEKEIKIRQKKLHFLPKKQKL